MNHWAANRWHHSSQVPPRSWRSKCWNSESYCELESSVEEVIFTDFLTLYIVNSQFSSSTADRLSIFRRCLLGHSVNYIRKEDRERPILLPTQKLIGVAQPEKKERRGYGPVMEHLFGQQKVQSSIPGINTDQAKGEVKDLHLEPRKPAINCRGLLWTNGLIQCKVASSTCVYWRVWLAKSHPVRFMVEILTRSSLILVWYSDQYTA